MLNFNNFKNPLVIAVGGGNDAVSALWMLAYFKEQGLQFNSVDILSLLPSCLSYTGLSSTPIYDLFSITPAVSRKIGSKSIKGLPEGVLAAHLTEFGIRNLYGTTLVGGSQGLTSLLKELTTTNHYDVIFCIDVGGDLIAHKSNSRLLSPYMDGHVGYAMRSLQEFVPSYGIVFGLGLDGENTAFDIYASSKALEPILFEKFKLNNHAPVTSFYLKDVAPIRSSKTGGSLATLFATGALPPMQKYSRTLHVGSVKFTESFEHPLYLDLAQHLLIFDDFNRLDNPYTISCNSPMDWVVKVSDSDTRPHHELVGQTIDNTYIATVSWLFRCAGPRIIAEALHLCSPSTSILAYTVDLPAYIPHYNLTQVSKHLTKISYESY